MKILFNNYTPFDCTVTLKSLHRYPTTIGSISTIPKQLWKEWISIILYGPVYTTSETYLEPNSTKHIIVHPLEDLQLWFGVKDNVTSWSKHTEGVYECGIHNICEIDIKCIVGDAILSKKQYNQPKECTGIQLKMNITSKMDSWKQVKKPITIANYTKYFDNGYYKNQIEATNV